ncbi:hypothetical protein CBM2589_A90463 [Cupriavidus taiwanensis]|uniref:Uncharacterized protein n=1 Tax=Cupriavidus taiwanensis TaxID=164546 RepID=A0A976A962_9BURK|nr:hypothetical protein CBM2589_A90463 [Cupriavidus taiwanensis]
MWRRCGRVEADASLPVCSPLPLAGEGPGERAGAGKSEGFDFVDASALSPTLSRKREREYGVGIPEPSALCAAPSFPCLLPGVRLQPVVMHATRQDAPDEP